MSPLRWTCKSLRTLATELQRQGFEVSSNTVGKLLRQQGYSLQANRKTVEGKQHPDRNAQIESINRRVRAYQRTRQPVISVDTKKKFQSDGQSFSTSDCELGSRRTIECVCVCVCVGNLRRRLRTLLFPTVCGFIAPSRNYLTLPPHHRVMDATWYAANGESASNDELAVDD